MLWLVLVAGGCAAVAQSKEVPVAVTGQSAIAEQRFRPILRRWVLGTPEQRLALGADLTSFCRDNQGDPLVRLAHVLRAFNALQQGDLATAKRFARDGLLGPAGTVRDLGALVVGAALRRAGDYPRALDRLQPLQNKLIDDFATLMLNEEMTLAALGAGRYGDALGYMEVWLLEASAAQRQGVKSRLWQEIAKLPAATIWQQLERIEKRGEEGVDKTIKILLVRRLAVVAVGERNAGLARRLMKRFGSTLGSYGEAIAALAAARKRPRVAAKTVGLLLALGSGSLRQRSADVAAGLTFGLKVATGDARLVTRDDAGGNQGVRAALAELAAAGAAVVVAGVTPSHSDKVARLAKGLSIPVILLTPDSEQSHLHSPFVFLAAEPGASSVDRLAAQLRKGGVKVVAGLGLGGGTNALSLERSCVPPPQPSELRAERVQALVVLDGAYCDGRLEVVRSALTLPIALGLGATLPTGLRRVQAHLATGVFPLAADLWRHPDLASPRLRQWLKRGYGVPSWFAALGRDAAVLALAAVSRLAPATEASEVQARRAEAAATLARVRRRLWTSDARGFDGRRRLPRKVRVVMGPPPKTALSKEVSRGAM